jgi:uncharacterized OB-fold protein
MTAETKPARPPFPRPTPILEIDAAFWDAIESGRFALQHCGDCGEFRHPPRPVCAHCGSTNLDFVESAGRGEVWSFTVISPPTLPAYAAHTPYGAVVVRLDEGVFMVSSLLDCPIDELAVGARVEVEITEVEPGLSLPLFRRVS